MKITLIYAGISQIGFGSYGKGIEESWISHGLAMLSASLKREGYNPNLIDLRRLKGWEEFREKIEDSKPDIVGVTMMSVDYNPALKALKIVKKVNPKIITFAGGPHPSIMPEETGKNSEIDHVFIGEGEITFPKVIKKIEKGEEVPRFIQGEKPNLDTLPFSDIEIFGGYEYPIPIEGIEPPFLTTIAGRGCIYNCSFCMPAERKIFGNKVRRRSVKHVIEELKLLKEKYDFKSFMIHDDCLTEDKEWVLQFCKMYKEEGFTQRWVCQSRPDIICNNKEMIKIMKEAGLYVLFVGFESGSQRILDILCKGTTVEQNYKSAQILKELGIKIWANYMFGVPTETKEEVIATVEMIKTIKPDHCSPAFFTPHPGTKLFDYCNKEGLSLIKSHDSYRRDAKEYKIKGIDYDFLRNAVYQSAGWLPPDEKSNNKLSYAWELFQKGGLKVLLKHTGKFIKDKLNIF